MIWDNPKKEDYYRHALMVMSYIVAPTRDWASMPPAEVIAEYKKECERQLTAPKKSFDYYEKKLNEFPEINI